MCHNDQHRSASVGVAQRQHSGDPRVGRRMRARLIDRIVTSVLWGLASIVVGVLAAFILYTIVQGFGILSWKFVTTSSITGEAVGPQVFNSFYILIFALAICIPLGLGGAIYLEEYARQGWVTTVLRFATETLAGIPSLILGLFGFLAFVAATGAHFGYSRLAGGLDARHPQSAADAASLRGCAA